MSNELSTGVHPGPGRMRYFEIGYPAGIGGADELPGLVGRAQKNARRAGHPDADVHLKLLRRWPSRRWSVSWMKGEWRRD